MQAKINPVLFLVLILIVFSGIRAEAEEAALLSIEGASALEHRLAVRALKAVVEYYEKLGFSLPTNSGVRILFQDPIHIAGRDVLYAHGIYDPATRTIRMIRFESEQFQDSTILGQKPCPDLYYSILVHECTHYVNSLICPDMGVMIDECVACYIQLSLLEGKRRESILSQVERRSFRTYREITMSAYIADTDSFVLASYCFCLANPKVLMKFLKGRAAPIKDPMLID